MNGRPILLATRGSALALVQANFTLDACRQKFPNLEFDLKIIKTTGDKLQTAPARPPSEPLPKGLFTKELEVALLKGEAAVAVHSLKDLPTDLPPGLRLAATAGKRADVQDVLVYSAKVKACSCLAEMPFGLVVGTGSARRAAQLLALRPDFKTIEIRGNVPTRLKKLAESPNMDATILAAAGLARLGRPVSESGELLSSKGATGLRAIVLKVGEMLPCVGQGAIGLETREKDDAIESICNAINDVETFQCATAERAFLHAMGGGCQTPVGAYASIAGNQLHLQVVSFLANEVRRATAHGAVNAAEAIGEQGAMQLRT